MPNIHSTYRIQFHKDFTFKQLSGLVGYFKDLGISTIYASPIFEAIPGSTHGYDGINPLKINPEIGTEEELIALSKKLKKNGINWLQDIVPNHMAFHPDNQWLMDVLEKWKDSPYFEFFDLDFPTPMSDKRLMVPFLGEPLVDAIQNGQLSIKLNNGKIYLDQSGSFWPTNEKSLSLLSDELTSSQALQQLTSKATGVKKLENLIAEINQNPEKLKAFADAQYYQLCPWQQTQTQLNYRRFFTVNALICLQVQHQQVFDQYHQYIFELVEKGIFQGLRIDHIDGLADPKTYLERLRKAVGPDVYLTVEKILGANEKIPADWPIDGNTGYDFLSMVNNLFTNRKAEKPLSKIYNEVTTNRPKVIDQIFTKKREFLQQHTQGELDHLYELLNTSGLISISKKNLVSAEDWKYIIGEFLVRCPVYRFYPDNFPLSSADAKEIKQIIRNIPATKNQLTAKKLFKNLVLGDVAPNEKQQSLAFLRRCMQFSGPLMAKGVEDTLMYTYNRFIGHTEVGDSLDVFGLSIKDFHEKMRSRLQESPLSINATATHDTKRGEDVRARLNILTDQPDKWEKVVTELYQLTLGDGKKDVGLHQNDAYLIFQTIFGAIPYQSSSKDQLEERLANFIEKALREAKKRSDWGDPNEEYENRAKKFITSLVAKNQSSFKVLQQFISETADFAMVNSLAQLLLKCTCPGIPDFYQGCELWDLSLVDPDNRRPVDFTQRKKWLAEVRETPPIKDLWQQRQHGKIKLWLTQVLLKTRNQHVEIFNQGDYIPLAITGTYRKNLVAYLRQKGDESLLTVVPLGLASISLSNNDPLLFDWKDTAIQLPKRATTVGESLLNGKNVQADKTGKILVSQLFEDLPMALIHFPPGKLVRGSGILMHITSLSSPFGIGNLGPTAHQFIDFLAEAGQKYWQLLPLNPTDAKSCHSPYCAFSALAGNTLMISPENLVAQNLLSENDLPTTKFADTPVSFPTVEKNSPKLLQLAFTNWKANRTTTQHQAFLTFCASQKDWLNDFALFTLLREKHQGEPWHTWPAAYRDRDKNELKKLEIQSQEALELIKFEQFIFDEQWQQLKTQAHRKGIKLIGDIPFYVAHNSADVWANRQFFDLDKGGEMTTVAGVPPDGFSVDGQRWGMPIFNWKALAKDKYSWWAKRIQKNIELFDFVRLDHFRAFHSYWQSAAAEETAINGWWTPGPGQPFFDAMKQQLGQLPFIAEDLGTDMDQAINFRKKLRLPGMRVLQFAFGEDMPNSPHAPHQFTESNSVAYAGTHDNNTIKGWFEEELDTDSKNRLSAYIGYAVNKINVHTALMSLVLSSTAAIAIIQMQDLIGLDAEGRMNIPGTDSGNWGWRLANGQINQQLIEWLKEVTLRYGR